MTCRECWLLMLIGRSLPGDPALPISDVISSQSTRASLPSACLLCTKVCETLLILLMVKRRSARFAPSSAPSPPPIVPSLSRRPTLKMNSRLISLLAYDQTRFFSCTLNTH